MALPLTTCFLEVCSKRCLKVSSSALVKVRHMLNTEGWEVRNTYSTTKISGWNGSVRVQGKSREVCRMNLSFYTQNSWRSRTTPRKGQLQRVLCAEWTKTWAQDRSVRGSHKKCSNKEDSTAHTHSLMEIPEWGILSWAGKSKWTTSKHGKCSSADDGNWFRRSRASSEAVT